MIQVLQDWIWNIGGVLLTISIFLFLITWIISWSINRLSGWGNKQNRENLAYWVRNKDKINEIIEKDKR